MYNYIMTHCVNLALNVEKNIGFSNSVVFALSCYSQGNGVTKNISYILW